MTPASDRPPAYRAVVHARTSERVGAPAGLVASVAVGVPVFLHTVGPDPTTVWGPLWLWWAAARRGLCLAARDDGRGVETLRPGNGSLGIRERIEALGGTVTFRSDPGQGLHITAEVPR